MFYLGFKIKLFCVCKEVSQRIFDVELLSYCQHNIICSEKNKK